MGEHIQLANGQMFKLGTCEDLFYVSFARLQQIVADGAKGLDTDPVEYLNPASGWRYRFPWPDEQGTGDDYNRAEVVTVPDGFYDDLEHERVSTYIVPISRRGHAGGGGYGVSLFNACPLSGEPVESSKVTRIVEIYEQRQIDGLLWVVCRCPYCGKMFRLPPDEAAELVAHIRREYARDTWTLKIADLVEAGYQVTP